MEQPPPITEELKKRILDLYFNDKLTTNLIIEKLGRKIVSRNRVRKTIVRECKRRGTYRHERKPPAGNIFKDIQNKKKGGLNLPKNKRTEFFKHPTQERLEFCQNLIDNGCIYLEKGRYVVATILGPRFQLSKIVWCIFHPDESLLDGEEIHHVSFNRLDDSPTNLLKLPVETHRWIHRQHELAVLREKVLRIPIHVVEVINLMWSSCRKTGRIGEATQLPRHMVVGVAELYGFKRASAYEPLGLPIPGVFDSVVNQ